MTKDMMADKDPLDALPPVARDKARNLIRHLPEGWMLGDITQIAKPTGTTFLVSFRDARGIKVAVNTIYCSPDEL